jgi:RNA polymerase sigma-70 factor, ECF subfamily
VPHFKKVCNATAGSRIEYGVMSNAGPTDETAAGKLATDELVVRASTNREAFGLLYDRFFPLVHRYCYRRLFDSAAADDVSSEVFLQVARAISRFPGRTEGDFRRWVYRIATNAINAHLRKRIRHGDLLRRAVDLRRWKTAEAAPRPAEQGDSEMDAVTEAMSHLSLREQTVLALHFTEGLSYEEVGNVLSIRPATLRVVASRAISNLRQRLSRRFGSPVAPRKERPAP